MKLGFNRGWLYAATAALALCAAPARATLDYLLAFEALYTTCTLDDRLGCSLCHGAMPVKNAYGLQMSVTTPVSLPIADRLRAVEPFDAEGDLVINIVEIVNNTNPSDLAEYPGAPPVPPPAPPPSPVRIETLSVSPHDVATSASEGFDRIASGLRVVGVGRKVYLRSAVDEGFSAGAFLWSLLSRPVGATAALSAASGQRVTLVPDRPGLYTIGLTATPGLAGAPGLGEQAVSTNLTLVAAEFVGSGLITAGGAPPANPDFPQCGACHRLSGNEQTAGWIQSAHASKLQRHLNGALGPDYDISCLQCHSLGFDDDPGAVNGGFDDAAAALSFELAQIPAWVAEAATSGTALFGRLDPQLQAKASIQCESCHGPGSEHVNHTAEPGRRIAGVDLSIKQCAQCHDSPRPFEQGYYQWSSSSHPVTADASEGRVAETADCLKCHTGEGFVEVYVKGQTPAIIPDPNPITCSSCHDPHFSIHGNQLRLSGDFTLDSGQTLTQPGHGGLCARCHNSRVANAETQARTNRRSPHHGTQADMFAGVNGVSFGLPFNANSNHARPGDIEGLCVRCHMAPSPTADQPHPPSVGGHSYAMRDDLGDADPANDILNAGSG